MDRTTKLLIYYFRIRTTSGIAKFYFYLFHENNSRISGIAETFRGYNSLQIYSINNRWTHLLWQWTQAAITPSKIWRCCYPLFHEVVTSEHENSKKLTTSLSQLIKDQSKVYHVDEIDQRKMNSDIRSEREHCHKNTLNELRDNMSYSQMRLKIISQQIGVSNWPTSYPFSEHGFDLNEQQLQDGIRIRYRWELINIPSMWAYGHKMVMQHAMCCTRGVFITIRHYDVRDLTEI